LILCLKFIERPSDRQVKKESFEELQNKKKKKKKKKRGGGAGGGYVQFPMLPFSTRDLVDLLEP